MKIRPAQNSDLEAIGQLNLKEQPNPWSSASLNLEFDNPEGRSLVAEIDAAVAGYIFWRNGADDAELMIIGVARSKRRQGVGKALISEMTHQCRFLRAIFLEVSGSNQGAVRLYQSLGFSLTHTRRHYYPDGTDALCMKLELANP